MRKILYLLGGFSILLLAGCSSTNQKVLDETKLENVANAIQSDQILTKYLYNAQPIQSNKKGNAAEFKFIGSLDNSFDNLTKKEQFEFMKRMVTIANEKIDEIKDVYSGDIYCGENYVCDINLFEFDTDKHEYSIEYSSLKDGSSGLNIDDKIAFDPTLDETDTSIDVLEEDPKVDETTSAVQEPVENTESTYPSFATIADATGVEWVQLTNEDKNSMIEEGINNLESHGGKALEDADWFIDALDAYFGEGSTPEDQAVASEKVSDVFWMSGLGGKAIIPPEE